MLDVIEKLPVTASLLIALLPLLLPRVRGWIARIGKTIAVNFTGNQVILRRLDEMAKTLGAVKYQVQTNDGGSLKDSVLRVEDFQRELAKGQVRLESYRQHDFWRQPRPGLEMAEDGQVNLASEAACRLFRVSDPDLLLHHSWLRFLDSHHVGEFTRTFRETAASNSIFRFSIRIRDEKGEDRGEWEFKATPIDAAEPKLYSGFFVPVDSTAKELAGRSGWLL